MNATLSIRPNCRALRREFFSAYESGRTHDNAPAT
jgi:hypothetical protein